MEINHDISEETAKRKKNKMKTEEVSTHLHVCSIFFHIFFHGECIQKKNSRMKENVYKSQIPQMTTRDGISDSDVLRATKWSNTFAFPSNEWTLIILPS